MANNNTRKNQENVFRSLYHKYKGTSMEVSSESQAHKELRYKILSKLFKNEKIIQVHDVGMGLASFYVYLNNNFPNQVIEYSGSDILIEYVKEVKNKYDNIKIYHRDLAEEAGKEKYDYLIMSGLFHQRRDSILSDWEKFAQAIIRNTFLMCNKAIAFNFITPFVDFYQTDVYYCNLPKLLNFINDDLSRFFVLHHNYALFEFTVFVYREEYIHSLYPQSEFEKYFKK